MVLESDGNRVPEKFSIRQWAAVSSVYFFIALILFLFAGDFAWWQGWVYAVLLFLASVGGRILAEKRHPGILAERERAEKAPGVKSWDKILAPLMAVSYSFPLIIVAGLDHRFGWSGQFSVLVNLLGLFLIGFGYSFGAWALVENNFFSGVVRIQTDRDHTVCDSGPYRIVRHPGYAGSVLPLLGIPLALSSLWTLIPAAFALIITIIRTSLEDRTLQEELPGYKEYALKVRYRLFPGIY